MLATSSAFRLGQEAYSLRWPVTLFRRFQLRHRQLFFQRQRLRVRHRLKNGMFWLLVAAGLDSAGRQPFSAGNAPSAIVVDPSFPFAYVANSPTAR